MGDEEHGLVGKIMGKALHEELLSLFVERGTELIKKEDRTLSEQGTGDGNTLGLPFAQSASRFLARRIESFGKGIDEVGHGGMEGLAYLFFGSGRIAHQKITAYRPAQQAIPLGHIDEVTTGSRRYGNLLQVVIKREPARYGR